MKALTWHGRRDVRITEQPDPRIEQPTDAVIRVTSTAICGSDLHLYELMGPYLAEGDVLGHEAMGIVEDVGSEVAGLRRGQRVVVPFNISCGHCESCRSGLQSQCDSTRNTDTDTGASLFGYTSLYGSVPGGQAEYLRVPHADYGPVVVEEGTPDEQFLYLSDILPTAWQAVAYCGLEPSAVLAVWGLGPVGQFAARIGRHLGHRVIAVEPVPERRALAEKHDIETIDPGQGEPAEELRARTAGRGPDAVIDAVGMEAHGAGLAKMAQRAVGFLPDSLARRVMDTAGIDRLAALHGCIAAVRRGGTVSLAGVYAGSLDPMPMMQMFDKQLTMRMGQCNVRRWTDDLLPLVNDPADPLGVLDLRTHRLPLDQAPEAYRMFQQKLDGCIKVVLDPTEALVSIPPAESDPGQRVDR